MRTPKIRFEGFDDEWDDVAISSVAAGDQGGGTPATARREFWEGTIPWIQSSDVKPGETTAVIPTKHITPEAIKNSAASIVPANSLAIVTRVGVGKLATMPFPYATSQDFISLTGLIGDINFLGIAIQRAILKDINKLQGSTIKGMTRSDVLSKRIQVPSPAEQKAIGTYFCELDELIERETQKLTHLHNLKSTMLTKMFPQAGSSVPQIRFEGFDGEWDNHSLGKVGTTFSGLTGKSKVDFGHGEAQYITYMNVFSNSISDPSMIDHVEIDPAQHQVAVGDVLFTTSSETPEEVGMSSVVTELNGVTYLNSFCFGYRPQVRYDLNFLANLLRSSFVRSQFQFLAQGISRFNISKTKAMNILIHVPSPAEQKAIGTYFRNLDELIELEEDKLTKLKNLKSSLLAKMFV